MEIGPDRATAGREEPVGLHHVAILVDGMRRSERFLGVERAKECARAAASFGVSYLTLCCLPPQNRRNSHAPMRYLSSLLGAWALEDVEELHSQNVRVRVIGRTSGLPGSLASRIGTALALTHANTGLLLTIAVNYSARDEILRAVKAIARRVEDADATVEDITQASLSHHLDTLNIPDPDLLIRTGGKQGLSDSLLWQCAYSEFCFVPNGWAAFTSDTLAGAIVSYGRRERRFGGLKAG